jgi:hypothetical protein
MMAVFEPILVAFSAMIIFLVAHVIVWQFETVENRGVKLIVLVSAFTYLATIVVYCYSLQVSIISHFWVSFPLYAFMMMLYIHFYMGIDRSVSIRILGETVLFDPEDYQITLNELEKLYPKQEMVKSRLDLLVLRGFLLERDGKYFCSTKGKILSNTGIFSQKLYGFFKKN